MRKFLMVALILFPLLCRAQTQLGVVDVVSSINTACIQYTILGACPITPLQATHVLVTYWDPILMIETTPRSGESILAGAAFDFLGGAEGVGAGVIRSIAAPVTGRAGIWTPGGGADTTHLSGNTNLHFHEARVYTIPSIVGQTCGACSQSDTNFTVNYISDIDVLWRYSQPHLSIEDPILGTGFMGVWGKLNPRVGFLTHGSKHVAGAAAAIRAAWIAFDPLGASAIPPDPRPLVLQPSTVLPVCWQLGYPKQART
ncbi:MAG: TraU family protein, partial [Candidatus Tectomicrobia bacterium]|nr:TraU family protein [Candidatus Tectomicrobia bacterium]